MGFEYHEKESDVPQSNFMVCSKLSNVGYPMQPNHSERKPQTPNHSTIINRSGSTRNAGSIPKQALGYRLYILESLNSKLIYVIY